MPKSGHCNYVFTCCANAGSHSFPDAFTKFVANGFSRYAAAFKVTDSVTNGVANGVSDGFDDGFANGIANGVADAVAYVVTDGFADAVADFVTDAVANQVPIACAYAISSYTATIRVADGFSNAVADKIAKHGADTFAVDNDLSNGIADYDSHCEPRFAI